METAGYLLTVIAVITAATFLTRVLPFVLLYKVADHHILIFLGKYLPPVMMVLLVVYTFKGEDLASTGFLPELGCLALTAILHLAFKHPLVSILGGTGAYMTLVQMGIS